MYRRTVGVCVAAGIVVALAVAGAKLWAQSGGSIQACVASNGNVRIEGIDNDGTPIYSFSWGVTNPATFLGGGGAGKPTFSDVSVTRALDAVSTKLTLHVATGKHLKEVEIDLVDAATNMPLGHYVLKDVLITSLSTGNAQEAVAFNFRKMTIKIGGATTTIDLDAAKTI
jgi:type VI protein secretion system component Hcp